MCVSMHVHACVLCMYASMYECIYLCRECGGLPERGQWSCQGQPKLAGECSGALQGAVAAAPPV